jgi:Zn-dependent protease with chaperone function
MPFVFLLVFALISFQGRWPEADWLGFYGSLLAPWVLVSVFWVLAAWQTHRFTWQLVRHPAEHGLLWRQLLRDRRRLLLALTACYLGVLFGFGWGYVARECAEQLNVLPLTELIQFSPLLLALVLCWSQFYRAERASHEVTPNPEPFIGAWAYLRFQVRHNLLLVVPPVILSLTMKAFFFAFPALESYDAVLAGAGMALLAAAIISVPWILRLFLGLKPLPAGPLRDRLQAAARRLNFRFNDILVWDTRRGVANAMVSGALPWVRYIVLTDLLIERLQPEEIEAVFGHEVGHIKHHHMLLYILFFVGSVILLTGVWKCCEAVLDPPPAAATSPGQRTAPAPPWMASAEIAAGPALLTIVSAYVFVVFGYLSRRCERQADLFGCRAVSCQAFIGALEKVADLNGIPRHHSGWLASWQHPSIAQRVEFIERLRDNPALEPHFQRSLFQLKLGLMTGLTVCLVVVIALVAWQLGPEHVWEMFRVR